MDYPYSTLGCSFVLCYLDTDCRCISVTLRPGIRSDLDGSSVKVVLLALIEV